MTWARHVAVLGWQAAVLLMSYFTVFTLSNCPQFTSVLGALCSALTCRASANERFGLTSRKRSVAAGEETPTFRLHVLSHKNEKVKGFWGFIAPLSVYWACMLFLNTPHTPIRSMACLTGLILLVKCITWSFVDFVGDCTLRYWHTRKQWHKHLLTPKIWPMFNFWSGLESLI